MTQPQTIEERATVPVADPAERTTRKILADLSGWTVRRKFSTRLWDDSAGERN